MERNYEEPVFINPPYFNFFEATDSYGFDFVSFEDNQFSKFINDTFLVDFITMRKAFIQRHYKDVKDKAHKLKGMGR